MINLHNPNINKGTLYLSGGGPADITEKIDRYFLENILTKDKLNKILFIPLAKTSDAYECRKSLKWIQKKFDDLNSSIKVEFILCKNLDLAQDLLNYDGIYKGGGNTYKLLNLVFKSGFDKKLLAYIHSGGIVFGVSAGVVFLGQDISTYIEDKYIQKNIKHKYTEEAGLSILGNHSVLTHFEAGDEGKINAYFKKHSDNVISIPAGVALVISSDSTYVVGHKPVSIFHPTGIVDRIPVLKI